MSDLATRLHVPPSSLTYRIGRLVDRGLVERSTCTEDGRGVWAAVTTEGRRALRDAAPFHVAGVRRHLVDALDPGELAEVSRILDRVACDARDPATA